MKSKRFLPNWDGNLIRELETEWGKAYLIGRWQPDPSKYLVQFSKWKIGENGKREKIPDFPHFPKELCVPGLNPETSGFGLIGLGDQ